MRAPANIGRTRITTHTCTHNLSANLDRVNLAYLDSALTFNSSVTHLGHILRSDLDDDDIMAVTWDMCWKANFILHTFSCCDPVVKTNYSEVFAFLFMSVVFGRYLSPLVH